MTQIAYFSLNVTPISYDTSAIAYIGTERQRQQINDMANLLGVSATAIAGAMAEENNAFDWRDALLDWYESKGPGSN